MEKNKTTHFMAGILMLCYVAAFVIIAGRFLFIETTGEVAGVDLKEWAKKKRTSAYTIPAERGKILDNQGMVLAYDRPTYRIYAILDPQYSLNSKEKLHVDNPHETAQKLAPFLKAKPEEIEKKLQKGMERKSFQVEFGDIGRNLSQKVRDEILKAKIPGIQFNEEADRFYPNGEFASHIIGFARREDAKDIKGITGMEHEKNDLLSGKNGHISYQRDKYNKKLLDPNEVIKPAEDGKNIYLTIDQKIQTLLEDVMSHVQKQYSPERITAIVMNPKTGEVLAMSNRPSYNPNNPKNVVNWYNDAVSSPFEAGSTFKMFTWAAAIEEGVYNGQEFYASGQYKVNEKVNPVSDHNQGQGWGPITYNEGFRRSSNVAASKLIWEKIGPDKYLEYLKDFHFDQKTGIDLPGEVAGKILYSYPLEKLTTSFGQGSTVSPIQQMTAATAIANNGQMMRPFVIKKIVDPKSGEIVKEKKPEVIGNPISKETSKQVMDLLESVVSGENGTGKPFQLADYSVAGKTGTAQIPNPNGSGYLTGHSNYVFSFLGMAPKDDPKLIMYVSVKQPKLDVTESGSAPVAFIFNNVMENGLHYLNIDPDKDQNDGIQYIKVPKLIGEDSDKIRKELEQLGLDVTLSGSGNKIELASVNEGEQLIQDDRVILVTNKPTMPDMTNWSFREVHELAKLLDLRLETIGNGYVIKQNIKKDTPIKSGDYLGVEFKKPNEKKEKQQPPSEETGEDATNQPTQ